MAVVVQVVEQACLGGGAGHTPRRKWAVTVAMFSQHYVCTSTRSLGGGMLKRKHYGAASHHIVATTHEYGQGVGK